MKQKLLFLCLIFTCISFGQSVQVIGNEITSQKLISTHAQLHNAIPELLINEHEPIINKNQQLNFTEKKQVSVQGIKKSSNN